MRALAAFILFSISQICEASMTTLCRGLIASVSRSSKVAEAVIDIAFKHRDSIAQTPEGAIWLDYLGNLKEVDLNAKAEGHRTLPNKGIVANVVMYMRKYVKEFGEEIDQLPNPRDLKPLQKKLLHHLTPLLEKASKSETIQRAELVSLADLFSVVATQQIYLKNNQTKNLILFGDFESILKRSHYSEDYLDSTYGKTALPLPSVEHLGFRRFIELEPTGVFPLGVTAKVESVDGVDLDPERFFEHDGQHQRFRMQFLTRPLVGALANRPVFDFALYASGDRAMKYSKLLLQQIDSLPTRRKRLIAEGLVFQILHEENKESGIYANNASHIRARARALIRSRRRGNGLSIRDYDYVLNRFQDEKDFGQAFKKKPTDAEILEILKWLSGLQ